LHQKIPQKCKLKKFFPKKKKNKKNDKLNVILLFLSRFDLPPAQSTELQQDPQKKRESLYYDISLIIETAFALTGEIFDLNGSNFWLQRQAFIFLKHYLHQAHRDKLQNIFLDKV